MFIRRTKTRNGKTGEEYFTFRLVETARIGGAVRQHTLLNLGAHFDLPQAEWPGTKGRPGMVVRPWRIGFTTLISIHWNSSGPAMSAWSMRR